MKFIALIFCSISACNALSQDTIYLRNGNYIDSRVTEIGAWRMKYQLRNTGEVPPTYKIRTYDVDSIKFETGRVDDLFNVAGEKADLTLRSSIHLNVVDLATERIGLQYNFFPGKKRNFSLFVPLRVNMRWRTTQWFWAYPWIESGIGAEMYIYRHRFINFSLFAEGNYSFMQAIETIEHEGFWEETVVNRHWFGFYVGSNVKFNFSKRWGVNVGLSIGSKFSAQTPWSTGQGKGDVGIFFRF